MTGIANVPEYIPRRIGEILRPPVLVGAALGGVLSLLWLRRRALLGAVAGVLAVVVFAAFATAGLPINTRYAFLAAAILCVFCGAGVFGWTRLARGDPRRRWWMAGGALVLVALLAYAPVAVPLGAPRTGQTRAPAAASKTTCSRSSTTTRSTSRCGPVGVPNHAPVPLLALYLKTSPREHRQRPGRRTSPSGSLRRPGEQARSKKTTCSTRTTRTSPVSVPPGLHRGARRTARG